MVDPHSHVCPVLIENIQDEFVNVSDFVHAIDRHELIGILIVLNKGTRLLLVDIKPFLHRFRAIICALVEFASAMAAVVGIPQLVERIDMPAGTTHPSLVQPANDFVAIHLEAEDAGQANIQLLEEQTQSLRLWKRSWKSIEDKTLLGFFRVQEFFDQPNHDVVRNKIAGLHECFCFLSEWVLMLYCFTQEISGGNVGTVEFFDK